MMILEVSCNNFAPFLRVFSYLFRIICYLVPIILIVLIGVDLVKSITSGDEKAISKSSGLIFKRILFAIIVFFIPTIVLFITNSIEKFLPNNGDFNSPSQWISCWNEYFK